MMNVFKVCCAAALAASLAFAQGGVSEVQMTGTGKTMEDAVASALENALLSQCGMTVSITRHSQASAEKVNQTSSLSDLFKHDCETAAKGRIEGFNVLSTEENPAGKWTANLKVRIYTRYIVGIDPNLRRRMAFAPFVTKQKTVSLSGKEYQTGIVLSALEDRLAESFTQTRKFTMLDRKYSDEVDAELKRLREVNASSADFARMNQKLVTDYLLCAEVTFFDPPATSTNPYNGITTRANTPLFSVAYRVLLAPTGQLKWADTVNVYPDAAMGASADDAFVNLMTFAASDICDEVMRNLIPMMIADVSADGSLVLNEGGKSVSEGETLNVYSLGKEINDPFTHESLGHEEVNLGTIQVTKVMPKFSYAKIASGEAASIVRGCYVRRPQAPAPAPTSSSGQNSSTIFRATPQGGVLPPFQQ